MVKSRKINRTNDYLFKRIFGSDEGKDALIGFLNAVLKPTLDQELTSVELLDRELDPKYLLDKAARLDILAKTATGALVNIEVQVVNKYNIDKRTLFYWAGLYHGQLGSSENFINLRKTITINILGFNWFRGNTGKYHHTFHIREDQTGELLNDDLEIHFLELGKVAKLKRKPLNNLEEWLLYLNNIQGEEMEEIAMGNPGIRKALTIEQIFLKNNTERRLYELREKAVRDEISMLAGARAEGEAKGEAKGRADAICTFLDVRFGKSSKGLQGKVKSISKLDVLDRIINKIYTAESLEDAGAIIDNATK
ncbi:Rpn family recombination-promoting nuclease/putative transposase [Desulfoscipio sp. XC116]|uniref:Rpn family recombination-promoting nuclease/putative transposase n=1 Tax=Desulfoscipio sp. XC116 TaxID=3144975 RepID=UPI00325BA1B4